MEALWRAIRGTLQESIDAGGAPFELNLCGQKGGWDDPSLFHWEEGAPCPVCGTPLAKIRTRGTGSDICPGCQTPKPPNAPAQELTTAQRRIRRDLAFAAYCRVMRVAPSPI